jgi:hypothetical protein
LGALTAALFECAFGSNCALDSFFGLFASKPSRGAGDTTSPTRSALPPPPPYRPPSLGEPPRPHLTDPQVTADGRPAGGGASDEVSDQSSIASRDAGSARSPQADAPTWLESPFLRDRLKGLEGGLIYGTLQGAAPLGFLTPSPNPSDAEFEIGRNAALIITSTAKAVGGAGVAAGGAAAGAASAAPTLGAGAVAGAAVSVAGVEQAAEGVAGVAVGVEGLRNAILMNEAAKPGTRSGGERRAAPEPKARRGPSEAPKPPGNSTQDPSAATTPRINAQKQAGHVSGTPQHTLRVSQGKATSTFRNAQEAEALTREAWANGTPLDANMRVHDFGRAVGTAPRGGGYQTQVRVSVDARGTIHGTPWGPVHEGPLPW